jgi:hypothetical protein
LIAATENVATDLRQEACGSPHFSFFKAGAHFFKAEEPIKVLRESILSLIFFEK